jgi:site-specific recombinase XerD
MTDKAPPPFESTAALKAAMGAFEKHMEREGFSLNTIKAFMSDLNILKQFAGAGRAVGAIGTQDLNDFLEWLQHGRGVPCNPKSLARRLTTLKVFFGWLVEVGVLERDPAAPVAHQPVSTPLPQILKEGEIERTLKTTQALRHPGDDGRPDARPHLLVTLLLQTGIKKGECMSLVLNHLDLSDSDSPAVWIRYQDPRRRHKERKLRLPQEWPAVFEEYQGQYKIEDALFPCTARNLEYVLTDVAQATGLPNGLSFEMLRWTSAVRDYKAELSAERQRQKMGLSKASWRDVKVKLARLAQKAL